MTTRKRMGQFPPIDSNIGVRVTHAGARHESNSVLKGAASLVSATASTPDCLGAIMEARTRCQQKILRQLDNGRRTDEGVQK